MQENLINLLDKFPGSYFGIFFFICLFLIVTYIQFRGEDMEEFDEPIFFIISIIIVAILSIPIIRKLDNIEQQELVCIDKTIIKDLRDTHTNRDIVLPRLKTTYTYETEDGGFYTTTDTLKIGQEVCLKQEYQLIKD